MLVLLLLSISGGGGFILGPILGMVGESSPADPSWVGHPVGPSAFPMYRKLRLCSDRGGYEAIPEPARPLDLVRVRHALEREGIAVVDARVMLIVGLTPEVTISRSGRLLFKTRDPEAAERLFARLRTILVLPGPEGDRPGGDD